jgi:blocked early in transport 1
VLSNQVSLLKELTIDIGNEVNSQNRMLDGMSGSMMDASGLLGGTLKKIGVMMKRGGSRHMCYLVGFIVFAFMMIWWIMSRKR